jgi:hypothetical protein
MKKNIKFFAIQEEHIKKLQEKLDEDKNIFFRELMDTPGWELFIGKHTNTYQRPKDVIPNLKNNFVKLEIEFEPSNYRKDSSLPSSCQFTVSYRAYHNISKFRTNFISFEEIENFINGI